MIELENELISLSTKDTQADWRDNNIINCRKGQQQRGERGNWLCNSFHISQLSMIQKKGEGGTTDMSYKDAYIYTISEISAAIDLILEHRRITRVIKKGATRRIERLERRSLKPAP